ncbi:MAG: hypothetical protein K2L21_02500 [Muribaculaceae bacterium]|nr:hypothetical protein [Muribaculaceae bacterium]
MNRIAITLFLCSVSLAYGCAAHRTVKLENAHAQDQRAYDKRFPIKVWTDAEGAMFIEDSLGQYYPSEEQLLAAIVGRGWKPAMCYDYYKLGTTPSHRARKMFVTDKGITGWIPGASEPLYFGENGQGAIFMDCTDVDRGKDYRITDNSGYKYDSHTGTVHLYVLDHYQLVKANEHELWFVHIESGSGERDFQIVKYTPLPPEELQHLQETYIEKMPPYGWYGDEDDE